MLTACGAQAKQKSPYNEKCQDAFESTIKVLDDVLAHRLDADGAADKIERIAASIEDSDDTLQKSAKLSINIIAGRLDNMALRKRINNSDDYETSEYDNIKETIESLKEKVDSYS